MQFLSDDFIYIDLYIFTQDFLVEIKIYGFYQ